VAIVAATLVLAAVLVWRDASNLFLLLALGISGLLFAGWVWRLLAWDASFARESLERQRRAELAARKKQQEKERRWSHRFVRWIRAKLAKRSSEVAAEEDGKPAQEDEKPAPASPPLRLSLTPLGTALIAATMTVGVLLVWWRVEQWWVAVSLAGAVLITAALWRVATLANKRLLWFGIAVFLSVPLFGTLTTMVGNLAHPKVQPMALIRETDGPKESIQGLYVTETDDRVYFANVATEGCENKVSPHSGRLLWVSKDEVVAMSLGPSQSVEQAGKSALEMSYALTPAVETLEASVDPPADETREEEAEKEARARLHDARLKNVGPAVRPNFGAGLSLDPEVVSPGTYATLRMSEQNKEVEGFGASRAGHNLRLGGIVVDIAKERAGSAAGAEYIKTRDGRLIDFGKEGPYVKNNDNEYVLLKDGDADDAEDGLYLRLADAAAPGSGKKPVSEGNAFVKVDETGSFVQVSSGEPNALLAAGAGEGRLELPKTVAVAKMPLYRQAWHSDSIKFRVPDGATTGVVTVECDQLAGTPLLQVSHTPTARISVRMRENSTSVTLNSRRSKDEDKEKLSRRWTIEGLGRGHRRRIAVRLPPRRAPYSVKLTVTDEAGHADTAELQLLRLPTSMFATKKRKPAHRKAIRVAHEALERAVAEGSSVAIELDGHSDDRGSSAHNLKLSLDRVDHVRAVTMPEPSLDEVLGAEAALPVQEVAYGASCPIDPREGMRPPNRRVDVFILGEGVTVKPTKGCIAGRLKSTSWHPPLAAGEAALSSAPSDATR
jgi:flagellar motor protein MotB